MVFCLAAMSTLESQEVMEAFGNVVQCALARGKACNNSQFQVNFYSRKFHYSLFTIHFSLFISEIFISYSRKLNYFNDNPRV